MNDFESTDRNIKTVPKGMEELDKEFGSILWISNQLSATSRLKPCKRKEALVQILTEMLEDSQLLPYSELNLKLSKASDELSSLKEELEVKQKELGNQDHMLSNSHSLEPELQNSTSSTKSFMLNVFVLISLVEMIVIIIQHHFGS